MRKLEEQIKYVCDTENEAKDLVAHFVEDALNEGYTLVENGYKYKCKKAKGEIVDEKWIFCVKKQMGGIFDEE